MTPSYCKSIVRLCESDYTQVHVDDLELTHLYAISKPQGWGPQTIWIPKYHPTWSKMSLNIAISSLLIIIWWILSRRHGAVPMPFLNETFMHVQISRKVTWRNKKKFWKTTNKLLEAYQVLKEMQCLSHFGKFWHPRQWKIIWSHLHYRKRKIVVHTGNRKRWMHA